MPNPFTPSFGRVPAILAGRDIIVDEMLRALDEAAGAPDLCTLYTGPRGMGKTALMRHIADAAGEYGWISASTVAFDGMLEELYEQAVLNTEEIVSRDAGVHLQSVSLAGVLGASWERTAEPEGNWRTKMTRLLKELNAMGTGLLLMVDEIDVAYKELMRLVNVVQHFFEENRKVALLLAGLPEDVSALVAHERASFLRRATKRELGLIPDSDVLHAMRRTVENTGKSIEEGALSLAVAGAGGYPYMMQLVGFRSWAAAGDGAIIMMHHVEEGVQRAKEDFENGVLQSTYDSLSGQDRAFLRAMLEDAGPSAVADIAQRMERSASYVQTYKRRLLAQGVIIEHERGEVVFGIPLCERVSGEALGVSGCGR